MRPMGISPGEVTLLLPVHAYKDWTFKRLTQNWHIESITSKWKSKMEQKEMEDTCCEYNWVSSDQFQSNEGNFTKQRFKSHAVK